MSTETTTVPPPVNVEKCNLVLVDVAGTTTSIDFVKTVLFPFANEQAEEFLKSKWEDDTVKKAVKQLAETDLEVAAAAELVKSLAEKESDNQGLKTIQGLIYKKGYEDGKLKGHIFDDVAASFESWAASRSVAIYSTGSVESQKLLFSHTEAGDITKHISKYFDQSVGSKTDAESYKKIAGESEVQPEDIVFITDNSEEAKAAKSAGCTAILIKREGNPEISEDVSKEYSVISSFKSVTFEKSCKRKIEDEPAAETRPAKIVKTDETQSATGGEKVETEEAMEVDAQPETKPAEEKATEETKEATKTNEQTETTPEILKEKTELDTKEEEKMEITESEEQTSEATTSEIIETKVETKENAEAEPAKEVEAKSEKAVTTTETKSVAKEIATETKPVEETVKETTEKKEETNAEKTDKTASEKEEKASAVAEEKPVEEVKPVEETDKTKTATEKEEKEDVKEAKSAEETDKTIEKKEEKTETETKADEKPAIEEKTIEEEKVETVTEKVEEKSDIVSNGDKAEGASETNGEVTEEKNEDETIKVEEKENKSVLANGVENGKVEEAEVSKASDKDSETVETEKDDTDSKTEETEVKVKKLEESAESKTVSVEV